MKVIQIVLLLGIVVSGCGAPGPMNEYLMYDKWSTTTVHGEMIVGLASRRVVNPEGSEYPVTWGPPYLFNAQYYTDSSYVVRGEIRNLRITSARDGSVAYSADYILDRMSASESERSKAPRSSFSFGTGYLDIEYRAYRISFDYQFYLANGDVIDSGSIEVELAQDAYLSNTIKGSGL